MANGLKIKRGDGTPAAGADGSNAVWPYELAWDYTNNKLYINDNGTIREITGTDTNTTYSASTGLDLSGTAFSVDVSDFMSNGVNNNILTATGTDAFQGETGLTYDGTYLSISGTGGTDGAAGSPIIRLNNTTQSADWDTGDVVGTLEYYAADASGNAPYVTSFIKSVNGVDGSNGTLPSGALSFGVSAYNAVGGAVEKMQLTSVGDLVLSGGSLTLPVAEKLYFGGGDHTYISEDIDDRLRFFVGGDEFMRFTQQDAAGEIISFYSDVYMDDNLKIHLGNSQDLRLFHDASNSYIQASGTGNLYIQQNTADLDLILQCDDGSGGTTAYLTLDGSDGFTTVQKLMRFEDNVDARFGTSSDLRIRHDGTDSKIDNYTGTLKIRNTLDDADITLETDNGSGGVTPYLTLDGSTGHLNLTPPNNVGIGTTSPTAKLEVNGDLEISPAEPTITLNRGNGSYSWKIVNGAGTGSYPLSTFNIANNAGTPVITALDSGNVGIGTTSPGTKLHISSGATDEVLRLEGTGSPYLSVYDSGTRQFFLQSAGNTLNFYAENDNTIAFFTSGTRAVDIDSSQRVGIGTISPAEKLDVAGNIRIGGGGGLFAEHSDASKGGTVIHPNGGTYRTSTSTHTGAIKITLPTGGGPADMLSFWVDVYDYTVNESFTCYLAGYAYQTAGSNEWVNEEALILSANQIKDFTVRFGHDGSNHCVYIGELASTWQYPQITVRNVQIGFNADVDTYNDGWGVGFEASAFQNVDGTQTDNFPYAKGLKSSSNMGVYVNGTEEFRFETDGDFHADADVIAYSTSVGSDRKLKKNIKDTPYGLSDVMKMRAVEFDWKEKRKGVHDIGVIAQEVEKIIPEVVKEVNDLKSDETHKVVDYAKLSSVLIKAIQEQQEQINELKDKLNG